VGWRRTRFPIRSSSQLPDEDWEALRDPHGRRAAADSGTGAHRVRSCTTARRASPRTTSSSSVRRRSAANFLSARGSTRSASPRPVAQAGRWQSGSVNGSPTTDLTGVDIRRFAPFNGTWAWLHDPGGRVLRVHYEIPWPQPRTHHRARSAVRRCTTCWWPPTRTSAAGLGWERANFFAPEALSR